MVILYGVGTHAMRLLEKYIVPIKDIEVIVDQEMAEKKSEVEDVPIITWELFLRNREIYKSKEIVIGARARYEEITNMLEQAGLNITYKISSIDKWIEQYCSREKSIHTLLEDTKRENMRQLYKRVGNISTNLINEAILLPNRTEGLKTIQHGGYIAEIGVAMGEFSKQMIDICKPKKFYAIDIFSDNTKPHWGDENYLGGKVTENPFGEKTHEEYYRERFCSELEKGVMEICRGLSWECIEALPEDALDFAYLDAAHDYESVKRDLLALKKAVRRGGVIQFDDYIAESSYGVIPAVNEFINETGSQVLYYCLDLGSHDNIAISLNK